MSHAPALSIIVPAYNEAARLPATLTEICAYLNTSVQSWEIRVVDDGSSDDTAEVVTAAASEPRIVLQREPHRGKGGAVRAGMLASGADLRFLCDADLSMPIGLLARFLALVPSSADVAIGSREGAGAVRVGEPEGRHTMGRGFNGLVRTFVLPNYQDTQCGFKLFSGSAATEIFSRVTIDGWAFDVEALVVAERLGLCVSVVPIEWHYRAESRVSPVADALRMARDVAAIRLRAWRGAYDVPKPRRGVL